MSTNNHPLLLTITHHMQNDQAVQLSSSIPVLDGDFDYDRAERALVGLTDEELETIAIGDQEMWEPIFQRIPDAEYLHQFLDELFMTVGC